MSTNARKKCVLKNIEDEEQLIYPHIEISDTDFVFVGRSPQYKLRDETVSRKQLKAKADFNRKCIVFEVLGANPSTLNEVECEKNKEYRAKHGDIIQLIPDKFPYKVHFENVDDNTMDENANDSTIDSTKVNVNGSTNGNAASDSNEKVAKTITESTKKPKRRRIMDSEDDLFEDVVPSASKRQKSLEADKAPFADTDAWKSYSKGELIVYTTADCVAASKIAAYDLDGTLITTKSGRVFPSNMDDWQFAFGTVKSTLSTQHANNHKLVIFTNQSGISIGKFSLKDFRKKIENVVGKIALPMQVFIATSNSRFRKPMTMMWRALSLDNGINIDMSKSFFVGDAAGRPESRVPKRKKDHSAVDRLFAKNLQLQFFTPEEHFLKQPKPQWTEPNFNPQDVLKNQPDSLLSPANSQLTSDTSELIIMVGIPGSGKSSFCKNHLASAGYVIICRDKLHNMTKCKSQCQEYLAKGKKVVIDNTNCKPEDRKHFIKIAKDRHVKCRCFVMKITPIHAEHNLQFRELLDSERAKISKVTFNTFKKYYTKPTKSEGFDEIVNVNFVPTFQNDDEKALYGSYLLGSYE